jgi:hypothetical protein
LTLINANNVKVFAKFDLYGGRKLRNPFVEMLIFIKSV